MPIIKHPDDKGVIDTDEGIYYATVTREMTPDNVPIWILQDDRFLLSQVAFTLNEHQGPLEVAVDLGAHVGIFALSAAFKGAKVYAFEPSDSNMELLLKNINDNDMASKILALKTAITNRSGDTLALRKATNLNTSGQRSLVFCTKFPIENYVITMSFKDVLKKVFKMEGRIDYLKCDIEGGEWVIIEDDPELAELVSKVGFIEMSVHPLGDDRYFIGEQHGDYVPKMEKWLEERVPGRWIIPWGSPNDRNISILNGKGEYE